MAQCATNITKQQRPLWELHTEHIIPLENTNCVCTLLNTTIHNSITSPKWVIVRLSNNSRTQEFILIVWRVWILWLLDQHENQGDYGERQNHNGRLCEGKAPGVISQWAGLGGYWS